MLTVLIPGWGAPFLKEKQMILEHNLHFLLHQEQPVQLFVRSYGEVEVKEAIHSVIRRVVQKEKEKAVDFTYTLVHHDGHLGEAFQLSWTWFTPDVSDPRAPFLLLLDDVEILHCNVKEVEAWFRNYSMDIVSCSVKQGDCHWIMATLGRSGERHRNRSETERDLLLPFLKRTNYIEWFAVFLTVRAFEHLVEMCQQYESKYAWGVDLLFYSSFRGPKVGVLNHMTVRHYFSTRMATEDARQKCKKHEELRRLQTANGWCSFPRALAWEDIRVLCIFTG